MTKNNAKKQGEANAEQLQALHEAANAADKRKTRKSLEKQVDNIGEQLGVKHLEKKLDKIDKQMEKADTAEEKEAAEKKLDQLQNKMVKKYKRLSEPERAVVDGNLQTANAMGESDKGSKASLVDKASAVAKTKMRTGLASKLTSGLTSAASKATGMDITD